jgi:hypothetical protein
MTDIPTIRAQLLGTQYRAEEISAVDGTVDFTMKVTVRDCLDGSDCVVIGEENTFVWVTVPPSQMRAFKRDVFLDNMPKPKKLSWSYQIVKTTAADQ